MVGELSRLKRSAARVRATELLDQFELSDAADRPVKTYSGGMRRRLDLAASLMARPPVLFLDEPTTGLDPTSRQRMWALIRDLVAEGVTVLLTTQYLDEADALANRIAVVDHGRLIAEGTPAELKASTGSQFLDIKLVSPHPRAVDVLKDLSIGTINVSESGRRLLVPARSQVGLAVAALRTLDEAGALVEDIAVHQPSLDDVFAVLTGTHETLALQEVPA
jgi:ABC-2 type transport system ATP-binding protein